MRRGRSATRFPFHRALREERSAQFPCARAPGKRFLCPTWVRVREYRLFAVAPPGSFTCSEAAAEVGPGRGRLSEGAGRWLVGGRDSLNRWHKPVRDRSLPRAQSRTPGSREPGTQTAAAQKFWRRAGLPGAEPAPGWFGARKLRALHTGPAPPLPGGLGQGCCCRTFSRVLGQRCRYSLHDT